MVSEKGVASTEKIINIDSAYKTSNSFKNLKKLGKYLNTKLKRSQSETNADFPQNTQIHYLTPKSRENSNGSILTRATTSTTDFTPNSDETASLNMGESFLNNELLEQLVKIEEDKASATNNHEVFQLSKSTPYNKNCRCNICSFYNGGTPPSMSGMPPEMYPKCIYKKRSPYKISGLKRKLVDTKRYIVKCINKI